MGLRRHNKIFGSPWLDSEHQSVPTLLWIAPAILIALVVIGCVGVAFLGWGV